jgi:hypothetical protein
LIIKPFDVGVSLYELSREYGKIRVTYNQWHKRYGGLIVNELNTIEQLEADNACLQRMLVNLSMDMGIWPLSFIKIYGPAQRVQFGNTSRPMVKTPSVGRVE